MRKNLKIYRNTFFRPFLKMRALSTQLDFNVFFQKLFSVFQFWTFLKMSIFIFGPDFFFNFFKQYILLIFELKEIGVLNFARNFASILPQFCHHISIWNFLVTHIFVLYKKKLKVFESYRQMYTSNTIIKFAKQCPRWI